MLHWLHYNKNKLLWYSLCTTWQCVPEALSVVRQKKVEESDEDLMQSNGVQYCGSPVSMKDVTNDISHGAE